MRFRFILVGLLFPFTTFGLTYETDNLPYTDVPGDLETKIAISTLTELGIVRGNPDGTFKPGVPINRAEFIKIAMGLLPESNVHINTRCFRDIDPLIWFAEPVCRAKQLGIVRGNAISGVEANLWLFEPTRAVKYEEALKILSVIYGIPLINASGEWYEKYTQTAYKLTIDLKDSAPGSSLTRGQMSRLVVAFLAYSHEELDELRYAETHPDIPVRTVFDPPSSSSVSTISSSSSSESFSSYIFDDMAYDTSTDEAVLILGKVTHVLGAAEIFSDAEPILVEKFLIDLKAANSSLEAIKVYDDRARLIGRATLDSSVAGNKRYRLSVKNSNIIIPKREGFTFYVRGVLRPQDSGGVSGGSIQVDQMGIEGIGYWSSNDYDQFTSGETYSATTVARSGIISVTNAGSANAPLIGGSDFEIGAFRFEGATGHSAARLDVTAIDFHIGLVGDITISSATMKVDSSSERHSCSVAGTTLTCSSIPASFGRIDDDSRTFKIYADIDIPDGLGTAAVQLSINDPGSIGSAGSITWTDGVTTFTWIDLGGKPVARGTHYSY